MPRLYCKRHGTEHEARVIGQEAVYRQDGEIILIVKGTLRGVSSNGTENWNKGCASLIAGF